METTRSRKVFAIHQNHLLTTFIFQIGSLFSFWGTMQHSKIQDDLGFAFLIQVQKKKKTYYKRMGDREDSLQGMFSAALA